MNTKKPGNAERFGRRIGSAWRRCNQLIMGWFAAQGLSTGVAITVLWVVKLVVLAILLYIAFWFALLLVFVSAVALGMGNKASDNDQEPEWRMGLSGYGLYRGETRIDPGSSDDN